MTMATWLRCNYRILLLVGCVLALLPSYLWAYALSAASESPTLNIGDRIIVNKASYALRLPYSDVVLFRARSPERGDMVLVRLPNGRTVAPKRVIGLPEETIELKENRVLVNGRELPVRPLNRVDFNWVDPSNRIGSTVAEEGGHWISFTPGTGRYRTCPSVKLERGSYFVIGDNRDESADSRIWGPVPESRILGKVVMAIHKR
ncbi:MAG: signal peptidase I [Acidobacteriaceae bacterium]|jgi:signal peptidase I